MTDDEVLLECLLPVPVRVKGGDYAYVGWLVFAGHKRRGAVRCAVEDDNGRLFIHSPQQLTRL